MVQELNLAYRFPVLFWNTANLIVDSGAADEGFIDEWEENEDGNVSEPGHIILGESSISDTEEELDQENEGEEVDKTSGKEKTINKTVNYGKISGYR